MLPSGAVGLTLRDDQGNPRAMLSLMADGVAGLVLFDSRGTPQGILATRKVNGASLSIMDGTGKVRGEFAVGEHGGCALALNDAKGEQRAVLSSPQDNRAGLMVFDSSGYPAVHVGESDGTKAMTLYGGRDHEIKLAAFVDSDATSSFHLFDKNGMQRGVWAATEQGAGISLFDRAERPRGVLGTTPQGDTGLLIFDERGDVRLRAPKGFDMGLDALDPPGQ